MGQITVAVDGTKVLANASKHAAVSYEHAGKTIQQLDLEVKELLAKAEQADSTPLEEGLSIPEEIQRRAERKAKLAAARAEIEARAQARAAAEMAEYQAKQAERAAQQESGKKPRGKEPQAPQSEPQPTDQYNFTDPESRIMKAGSGQHFEQSYNAQAAVEVDSRLIVGQRVSQAPNDKEQLVPTVATVGQAGRLGCRRADRQWLLQRSSGPSGGTRCRRPADRHDGLCGVGKKRPPPDGRRSGTEKRSARTASRSQRGRGDEIPAADRGGQSQI